MAAYTGWTRETWAELADKMLLALRPYATPQHSLIIPPGKRGGYGRDIDGLEGFARSFLLAGFRIAGESTEPLNLIEWYAEGIKAGVDPNSHHRWIRPDEHSQAKVEAASLALILDMTRDKLWNNLPEVTKEQTIEYFSTCVGDQGYARNNWLWFRVVTETFLKSVGGPWSEADIEQDLALHDSFRRDNGWIADGWGRNYDHYVGWALHLYPTLWQRMEGARELASDARREADKQALDRYLQDAVHLVGGDGAPLFQGRSLIYRFASAAPFWAGIIAEVPSVKPGQLRRAASGIVKHFTEHGVPDENGLLNMGWWGEWRDLAQAYSGPGSPYWAAKGMLGLSLPADHPAWLAPEEPLPVEEADFARAIKAPGWLAVGTKSDGIVRVYNHGTDGGNEGQMGAESPLYARMAYSTATAPMLDENAWRNPVDSAVTLVDAQGNATHRAGFRLNILQAVDGVGLACSTGRVCKAMVGAAENRGHGRHAPIAEIAVMDVASVAKGASEIVVARVSNVANGVDVSGWQLRFGGWAVLANGSIEAQVVNATEDHTTSDGPKGPVQAQTLTTEINLGKWQWAVVCLGEEKGTPQVTEYPDKLEITWTDGSSTSVALSPIPSLT
ncbi:MAG: DUF2264 domain-containing protein [Propionibacteriaceae bacterium]|nr:DUF2264 domain-containing protein [Propionibacteriaceae bacterium]